MHTAERVRLNKRSELKNRPTKSSSKRLPLFRDGIRSGWLFSGSLLALLSAGHYDQSVGLAVWPGFSSEKAVAAALASRAPERRLPVHHDKQAENSFSSE